LAVPAVTLNSVTAALDIREDVPLAPFTTFGIGGPARYFAQATTPAHLQQADAWAKERALPLFVLGGGSNLLVRDTGFPGLVLHMQIFGTEQVGDGVFAVGAGENWDDFVSDAVHRGFAGMECLAGIPGSVGGTPVQNVGAYGQEVAETILSVSAFDRHSRAFVALDQQACRFRYRRSLFNTEEPNRYIVHRVDFQLRANGAPSLRYADLQRRFANATHPPTLTEVASAVRDIRGGKGMLLVPGDPDCRSAGSFFKNPILPADVLDRIAAELHIDRAHIPHWPAGPQAGPPGTVKLPAAWLLERAGFAKGFRDGPAAISSRHTLALTNRGDARGHATCADIERLQDRIVATVHDRFGITLEREPVLLG
jgi:UDP-N-acetylmuramate dehydrogenase